ncbi:MAG TPA: ATP-binding protein [Pyrinomonadaceae bacterium]|nr:ATP-binding protein [Pyrinomonadaceae bacterium]
MAGSNDAKIFAGRKARDFVGRSGEVDRLAAHAVSEDGADGILVLAAPGAGASELLRQTYDRLFHEQREIIPFYFAVRRNLTGSREMAEDFLHEFIRQLVAFRRHDPAIVRSAAGLDELAELSLSVSGIWIDRLIATARDSADGRAFLRTCLSAPIRAAANGDRAFLMIDDAHHLDNVDDGARVFDELKDVFENAGVKFAVSGYRRFLHRRMDCGSLELNNLDFEKAGDLVEVFAKESGLSIAEQPRDLIAAQLAGNPALTRAFIREAADSQTGIGNFQDVQTAYAEGIFDGRIARRFHELFSDACGSPTVEHHVLRLLSDIQSEQKLDRALWARRMRLDENDAEAILRKLNVNELVRSTASSIEPVAENIVLTDFIAARVRLKTAESRANVFGDSLTGYIKRAPEIMGRLYRFNSSIGVREILGAFDGREVPTLLIDYAEFRDKFKTVPDTEVLNEARYTEALALPRIFFTTSAASFYKPLSHIAETERSAIALGFEASDEDSNNEVVWIAAEIDSKLEADSDVVGFWCDRLEAAALMCDFARFRIWLIAPEGFSPEASEALKSRNAYGSSRRQADLLRRFLNAPKPASEKLAPNEYEIVIPMDADAELIAAHAVEEIAKRHNLDAKSINQIKTALIEACINASEHSLSPDRKIYQRFRLEEDRVVLTVSNRGLRLASVSAAIEPEGGRRGWGLKLMRKLMDEVTIEDVDDGTRIVMTKFLGEARA